MKKQMLKFGVGMVSASVALMVLIGMVWFGGTVPQAQAAALTAERDTPEIGGESFDVTQGSNVIYAGAIVVINSAGTAEAGTDAASKRVVGRCERTQDNTGVNYKAARTIRVKTGVFRWVNGGSFTDANIGDLAYISDDQTVTTGASASQDIIAGTIVDVDSDGVWVNTYRIGANGAASVTTLAASGAATLGSTMSVAGAATLSSTATIGGAATCGSTLTVTGAVVCVSTVQANGFKIGAVSGYSGIATNKGTGYTNLWCFSGGVLTNVTFTGNMP